MTLISKLLAASAMAVALGSPAMALDLNAATGLGVGITLHDNNGHNGGSGGVDLAGNVAVDGNTSGNTNADVNADVSADTNLALDGGDRDGRFLGRSVISADGHVIGTVSEERDNGDASREVVVKLADGFNGKVRSFSLDLAADVMADGDLKLGWTQAELMANLDAQVNAQGNDG